jgi:hypothetical protein
MLKRATGGMQAGIIEFEHFRKETFRQAMPPYQQFSRVSSGVRQTYIAILQDEEAARSIAG